MKLPDDNRGIVLAGGGMRGAYAAGVIVGLMEVLDMKPDEPAPFNIFAGASIGAINAAFLAGNTHAGDMNTDELRAVWTGVDVSEFLHIRPFSLAPSLFRAGKADQSRSLLDPAALEQLIASHEGWPQLHKNIRDGLTRALFVAALDASNGQTTIFAELSPDTPYAGTKSPLRRTDIGEIGPEHLLASAALPLLFPPRRIGARLYFDGGLRFNTPISPVLRAGADKLVVVSLASEDEMQPAPPSADEDDTESPGLVFLLGKLLNTLIVDPIDHDLMVLERTNAMMDALMHALDDEQMESFQQRVEEHRGARYRKIDTLVLRPTTDLGKIALEYLAERGTDFKTDWVSRMVLKRAYEAGEAGAEADWASYILFDGGFAERLIAAGRADTQARADEICAFFSTAACT